MTPAPPAVVCVNGRFGTASEAAIPALDSGFLYGDGVFETFLVLSSRAVFGERHRARLAIAAAALGIALPEQLSRRESFDALVERLASENDRAAPGSAAGCRVSVSRGPRPPGPLAPSVGEPTWVAALFPAAPPDAAPAPVDVGISADIVFAPAPWTRHKTLSSLHRVLGRREALRRGLDDVIFADASSRLAESTSQHLFLLFADGRWATPPLSLGILPGITREILLEGLGPSAVEREIVVADLADARGGCLTSAIRGVVPLSSIEGGALPVSASAPLRRLWTGRVRSVPPGEASPRRA